MADIQRQIQFSNKNRIDAQGMQGATGPDMQDFCVSLERSRASQKQKQMSIHHNVDESEHSLWTETGKGTCLQGCECLHHSYLLSFSHGLHLPYGSSRSLVRLHK